MSSSSTDGATLVDVAMPQMGVSVAEGTVVEWRKQPGDWVQADETICEISTDKIDTEVPSPASGRVVELLVAVGTTVDTGTTLARIATDAHPGEPHGSEIDDAALVPVPDAPSPAGEASANAARAAGEAIPEAAGARRARDADARRYSPVVQRIAHEHGVDLTLVPGSGRGGRVQKKDVLAFLGARGEGAPAPDGEPPLHIDSPYRPDTATAAGAYVPPAGQPLSRMRRQIGEHMKRSQQTAATCTTWIEVDVSRIERERTRLGITALPLIARCAIGALGEFPQLNAWLDGEVHTVHQDVNLGVAVSLGDDGLIVPVVHGAQDLSPEGLARRIRDLAGRARSGGLSPEDVRGATFTITNPGQFGSIMATPVIAQPQVAILDVEAIVKRPVVVTDETGADAITIRPMVILGLSWDHRALDGALAARFLACVKARMERFEA